MLDNFPFPGTNKRLLIRGLFIFMNFIVYILYSEKFNKHYVGFTANLEIRLKSHDEFGKDWTMRYRPWRLIYRKEFEDKVEAMDYEKWLKTGVGREFINSLQQ